MRLSGLLCFYRNENINCLGTCVGKGTIKQTKWIETHVYLRLRSPTLSPTPSWPPTCADDAVCGQLLHEGWQGWVPPVIQLPARDAQVEAQPWWMGVHAVIPVGGVIAILGVAHPGNGGGITGTDCHCYLRPDLMPYVVIIPASILDMSRCSSAGCRCVRNFDASSL